MSIDREHAAVQFQRHFGGPFHWAARAPGRVNLIGEHTDYNHGFVLPMALDRETVILARPGTNHALRVFAANYDREHSLRLGEWIRTLAEPWIDYIAGVAKEVEALGHRIPALDCLVIGDVPIGAGLSSSASIEMAAVALFEQVCGFSLATADAASLGKRVENQFLGVASGIMDQFISRGAREGHALFLDCRTNAFEHVPIEFRDALFVVSNTGVTRGLTSSKYNERVDECSQAISILNSVCASQHTHLRDFDRNDLEQARASMPAHIFRRARYVVTENERTITACVALKTGDAVQFGKLMNESDRSLRDDYEVTCPELDAMTSIARALPGCYGSRMTGAGFGGCTVSLVARDRVPQFCDELTKRYDAVTRCTATTIVSSPAAGAGPL